MVLERPFLVWLLTLLTLAAGYALGRWGYAIDGLFQSYPCYPAAC